MSGTREEHIIMARVAEQCERYDDMARSMNAVATMGSELNLEERNLFSAGYKNAVAARRQAWRSIIASEQAEVQRGTEPLDLEALASYRGKVEEELTAKCYEVLEILGRHLVPKVEEDEAKVFYLKMKADYYRYLSEVASGTEKGNCTGEALAAYKAASAAAETLPQANPVKLGLQLNYSVFQHEVLEASKEACLLASTALDAGSKALETLDEDQQRDAAAVLSLLSDNLRLWTAALSAEEAQELEQEDGTAVEEM